MVLDESERSPVSARDVRESLRPNMKELLTSVGDIGGIRSRSGFDKSSRGLLAGETGVELLVSLRRHLRHVSKGCAKHR